MSDLSSNKHARLLVVLAALLIFPASAAVSRRSQNPAQGTFDPPPEWRPTHSKAGTRYLGNAACAQCHDQVKEQAATPMARALIDPAQSEILRRYPRLSFEQGPFSYSIIRKDGRSLYEVTDGVNRISLPILYAFGLGKVGQTFMLQYEGKFYESRVSFYGGINGLDLTLGASKGVPASLESALGRVLDSATVNDCFSCHSTASVIDGALELGGMTPGITCEGCHGAGEKHVATMKLRPEDRSGGGHGIFNPGRFDTEGQTQFCGACHRSWIQVQIMGIKGVENVRFQPYRIFNSKCYDHADKRIACTACHNPHSELVSDVAFYDAKCHACHQPGKAAPSTQRKAPPCPRAKSNCASCHMPRVEFPGAHYSFTDHQIRIVRPGEPYPG